MAEDLDRRKRSRDDGDSLDSAAAKKIREDLLGLLDDSDSAPPGDGADSDVRDLASVMRSFEEELSGSGSCVPDPDPFTGESLPELGFLLGASDDELGLPSTANPPESTVQETACGREEAEPFRVPSEPSVAGDMWQLYDEFPGDDEPFGFCVAGDVSSVGNEFVALDGIFDYSDVNFGLSDYTYSASWRQETLPAL